jgi:hypothetical protein
MYEIGQMLQGEILNAEGEYETVVGTFVFRTDDPEEYIQDIVLDTANYGRVYCDEQDVRPVVYL